MSAEMVIENKLSAEGLRRVHVMALTPISIPSCPTPGPSPLFASTANGEGGGNGGGGIVIPDWAEVRIWEDEIRLHHLEATWPARGELVEFSMGVHCKADCPCCHGRGCAWRRVVGLWMLRQSETIREGIRAAAEAYALATGRDPLYAWVRRLPREVEWGAEVAVGGEAFVNLYSADWMPERAAAVGRGN